MIQFITCPKLKQSLSRTPPVSPTSTLQHAWGLGESSYLAEETDDYVFGAAEATSSQQNHERKDTLAKEKDNAKSV